MALTDSAGLLFRIRADNKDAVNAIKETGREVKGLDGEVSGLSRTGALASAGLAAAAGAVTALGVAAIATTRALFNMAVEAGRYGAAIKKASDLTGISAENLTAFDLAAQKSGESLEGVVDSIASFSKKVAEASEGSKKATADLMKFGLDPKKAIDDLDGSLARVFKTINDAPPGIRQIKLATDAFGDSGAKLIPILKIFDGDMAKLVDRAKELGLTLTDEGAQNAKEFDDALKEVSLQLNALTRQIGTSFMPVFLDMARKTSSWLSENQGEIRQWSNTFAAGIEATITRIRDLIKELLEWRAVQQWLQIQNIPGQIIDWATGIRDLRNQLWQQREQDARVDKFLNTDTFTVRGPGGVPPPSSPDLEAQKRDAEKAAKEREALAKRDADAQVRILENQMKQAQDTLKKSYESFKKIFEDDGDKGKFLAGYEEALTVYNTAINDILPLLLAAEGKVASQAKKTAGELGLLAQEQEKRLQSLRDFTSGLFTDKEDTLKAAAERRDKEAIDAIRERIEMEIKLRESATRSIRERLEKDAAIEAITQEELIRKKTEIETVFAKFKLDKLMELQAAVKGNAAEEKRVATEIALFKDERERNGISIERAIGELQIKNAEELLKLKRQIVEEERRILDFRAEQERKSLVNLVDAAPNRKAKKEAIAELAAFDIAEAERKRRQREDDLEAERKAALERVKGKENEEAQKFAIEELYRQKRLISEEEFQAKLKEIRENAAAATGAADQGGFFGSLFGGLDDATGNIRDFEDVLNGLGNAAADVFMKMGQGLGNMLQQWVLLGDQAGVSMRKMVAAVLAGVAAQAATLAIFHLAMGIAALTPWGAAIYGPAPLHFKAAAIWGAVAVGAALAGRAIAGNSFKQQTASATGGASGQSTRNSDGQGRVFSSNQDAIAETSVNSPSTRGFTVNSNMTVYLKDDSTWLGKMLQVEVDKNGPGRAAILRVAESV